MEQRTRPAPSSLTSDPQRPNPLPILVNRPERRDSPSQGNFDPYDDYPDHTYDPSKGHRSLRGTLHIGMILIDQYLAKPKHFSLKGFPLPFEAIIVASAFVRGGLSGELSGSWSSGEDRGRMFRMDIDEYSNARPRSQRRWQGRDDFREEPLSVAALQPAGAEHRPDPRFSVAPRVEPVQPVMNPNYSDTDRTALPHIASPTLASAHTANVRDSTHPPLAGYGLRAAHEVLSDKRRNTEVPFAAGLTGLLPSDMIVQGPSSVTTRQANNTAYRRVVRPSTPHPAVLRPTEANTIPTDPFASSHPKLDVASANVQPRRSTDDYLPRRFVDTRVHDSDMRSARWEARQLALEDPRASGAVNTIEAAAIRDGSLNTAKNPPTFPPADQASALGAEDAQQGEDIESSDHEEPSGAYGSDMLLGRLTEDLTRQVRATFKARAYACNDRPIDRQGIQFLHRRLDPRAVGVAQAAREIHAANQTPYEIPVSALPVASLSAGDHSPVIPRTRRYYTLHNSTTTIPESDIRTPCVDAQGTMSQAGTVPPDDAGSDWLPPPQPRQERSDQRGQQSSGAPRIQPHFRQMDRHDARRSDTPRPPVQPLTAQLTATEGGQWTGRSHRQTAESESTEKGTSAVLPLTTEQMVRHNLIGFTGQTRVRNENKVDTWRASVADDMREE